MLSHWWPVAALVTLAAVEIPTTISNLGPQDGLRWLVGNPGAILYRLALLPICMAVVFSTIRSREYSEILEKRRWLPTLLPAVLAASFAVFGYGDMGDSFADRPPKPFDIKPGLIHDKSLILERYLHEVGSDPNALTTDPGVIMLALAGKIKTARPPSKLAEELKADILTAFGKDSWASVVSDAKNGSKRNDIHRTVLAYYFPSYARFRGRDKQVDSRDWMSFTSYWGQLQSALAGACGGFSMGVVLVVGLLGRSLGVDSRRLLAHRMVLALSVGMLWIPLRMWSELYSKFGNTSEVGYQSLWVSMAVFSMLLAVLLTLLVDKISHVTLGAGAALITIVTFISIPRLSGFVELLNGSSLLIVEAVFVVCLVTVVTTVHMRILEASDPELKAQLDVDP